MLKILLLLVVTAAARELTGYESDGKGACSKQAQGKETEEEASGQYIIEADEAVGLLALKNLYQYCFRANVRPVGIIVNACDCLCKWCQCYGAPTINMQFTAMKNDYVEIIREPPYLEKANVNVTVYCE